jgi:hypothetical protein
MRLLVTTILSVVTPTPKTQYFCIRTLKLICMFVKCFSLNYLCRDVFRYIYNYVSSHRVCTTPKRMLYRLVVNMGLL